MMATVHEQAGMDAANEWLRTLPKEVRINTLTTQAVKEHWLTNSPRQLAISLADAVTQKVWEQIAYMPAVESKREVRSYTFMSWCRECIGAEPDELFRTIAGHNPSASESSAATMAIVGMVKEEEPETLRELCIDHRHGETNMLGWDGLLKQKETTDPAWGEARAALQEAVKNGRGRPQGNAAQRAAMSDTTLGADRKPTDRKSRLIRTLTNLEANPDECKKKGTTPEKVKAAKSRLIRGLTPSVEAAKREAGLATKDNVSWGLGVRGGAEDVAQRLIRMVGKDHAKKIAKEVLKQLSND